MLLFFICGLCVCHSVVYIFCIEIYLVFGCDSKQTLNTTQKINNSVAPFLWTIISCRWVIIQMFVVAGENYYSVNRSVNLCFIYVYTLRRWSSLWRVSFYSRISFPYCTNLMPIHCVCIGRKHINIIPTMGEA
jgi:hypothetical protein